MTHDRVPPPSFIFGMILVIAALGFKIAAVPFHFWVPDVYEGAPTPITAFLAMGSKAAGFAALLRLLMTVFMPAQAETLAALFAVLSAATILYGNLGAIPQRNIKRLLGYSSIGHAGYLLMGMAAFWQTGKEAVLFYLASYVFSTAGAFLVVVWVSKRVRSDAIADYAGLAQRSPVLAAGMLLALASLAGVPPLGGFFAKFYILSAALRANLLWLAVIGAVNVVTSLYYYLGIVKVMYADPPAEAAPLSVPVLQKAAQYASMAGIVLLGAYPGPLVALVDNVFLNLLRF
jgi:NADH-quinone oxidoreductase subunit N